jgi:predicted nucleotidyltransferase
MNTVITKCKDTLKKHYGTVLHGVILYGSSPVSYSDFSSDIDLIVLLNKSFDFFKELRQISELLYPIQLESDQLISAKPAKVNDFEDGTIQLYRNAKRNGLYI